MKIHCVFHNPPSWFKKYHHHHPFIFVDIAKIYHQILHILNSLVLRISYQALLSYHIQNYMDNLHILNWVPLLVALLVPQVLQGFLVPLEFLADYWYNQLSQPTYILQQRWSLRYESKSSFSNLQWQTLCRRNKEIFHYQLAVSSRLPKNLNL